MGIEWEVAAFMKRNIKIIIIIYLMFLYPKISYSFDVNFFQVYPLGCTNMPLADLVVAGDGLIQNPSFGLMNSYLAASCTVSVSSCQGFFFAVYTAACTTEPDKYERIEVSLVDLPSVPTEQVEDMSIEAFQNWFNTKPGLGAPAVGYNRGAANAVFAYNASTGADVSVSSVGVGIVQTERFSKNVDAASLSLTPISELVSGSASMIETNNLLTTIVTNTAGLVSPGAIDVNVVSGGGGGGVSTDMTATNNLIGTGNTTLGSINDAVSGISTLPAQGVPAAVSAYLSADLIDHIPTVADYTTEYNTFKTDMEATSLYGLIAGFFSGVPAGGSSVYSFSGGVFGNHSYDFASWGSVMTLLRGLTLVAFGAASLRIIFLKGGS